ncbi:hypothetical protein DB32_007114 [Sandaracinus amylolyticus]|uniref:Uncharacterized protein n=1 Tax=Sandaracinus amylolyticus TaxID=927083 RepID=A0A0F6W8F5_9BACT|nr:hypothetical protein DB32_007114 [Sandaracinus amylolyticus]
MDLLPRRPAPLFALDHAPTLAPRRRGSHRPCHDRRTRESTRTKAVARGHASHGRQSAPDDGEEGAARLALQPLALRPAGRRHTPS